MQRTPQPEKAKPRPQEQGTPHPETLKRAKQVPGDESSKTTERQRDARTGQDKDGNEERAPATKTKEAKNVR